MQTILTAIIAAIVALAVMNTMLMAIQERYTEFGIMAAIGAKPRQIIGMVVSESFFLGLIGIVAGLIISMLGFLYFGTHGVNLASFSEGVAKFIGLKTVVYPVVKVKQVVLSCLFVLASSTFIALLPAVRAVRLDAVQAIRHI
jgi:ABC-type antimicrobial peptide transport system permease subunit